MSETTQQAQRNLKFVNGQTIPITRAARMLNVSNQTIRRLIECGILDAHQVVPNGWWQVSYASVVDYVNHLADGGTPQQYLEKKRAL